MDLTFPPFFSLSLHRHIKLILFDVSESGCCCWHLIPIVCIKYEIMSLQIIPYYIKWMWLIIIQVVAISFSLSFRTRQSVKVQHSKENNLVYFLLQDFEPCQKGIHLVFLMDFATSEWIIVRFNLFNSHYHCAKKESIFEKFKSEKAISQSIWARKVRV